MKPTYRHGIFLVVYSKDKGKVRYIILKRKLHWKGWEFPKGGIEKNEPIKKAIIREAQEETGFKPLMIKKFNIKGKYNYKRLLKDRPGFMGQSYRLYSVQIKYGKIRLDKIEHSGYKWLEFKDAVKKLTWPNQKKCLRIVERWVKKK